MADTQKIQEMLSKIKTHGQSAAQQKIAQGQDLTSGPDFIPIEDDPYAGIDFIPIDDPGNGGSNQDTLGEPAAPPPLPTPQAPQPADSSFGAMAKNFLRESGRQAISGVGGIISGTTQFAGNVAHAVGSGIEALNQARYKAMDPNGPPKGDFVSERLKASGDWIAEAGKESGRQMDYLGDMAFGTDEEKYGRNREDPMAGKVTSFLFKEIVAPAVTASALFKTIGLMPKVAEGASALKNAAPVAKTFIQQAVPFIARSLGQTAIQKAGSTSELMSGTDAGIGIGVDLVVGGLGKAISTVGKNLFSSTLSPELRNASKADLNLTDKMASKLKDVMESHYMGTAKMVLNQIKSTVEESGNKMVEIIKKVPNQIFNGQELMAGAKEEADRIATELAGTGGDQQAKAFLKNIAEWTKANGEVTKDALLGKKRLIAQSMAKVFGKDELDMQAKQKAGFFIWKVLDNTLDSLHPEIASLNKEMSTAYSILPPINKVLTTKPSISSFKSWFNLIPSTAIGTVGGQALDTAGNGLASTIGKATGREGILGPLGAMSGRKAVDAKMNEQLPMQQMPPPFPSYYQYQPRYEQ